MWYSSKDATLIPMYLVHVKRLTLDRNRPVLLSAYGGFGAISLPFPSAEGAAWVRAGGVFAFANIRGGGELGDAWHKAAILDKRQNAFDDFAAAGEWLIREGFTRPERLAISGTSNGGTERAAGGTAVSVTS